MTCEPTWKSKGTHNIAQISTMLSLTTYGKICLMKCDPYISDQSYTVSMPCNATEESVAHHSIYYGPQKQYDQCLEYGPCLSDMISIERKYLNNLASVEINQIRGSETHMEYCNNCDRQLPQDKFDLHLGYCRRNIKRCVECNQTYDINQHDEHIEEYHRKIECQYCKIEYTPAEIQQHCDSCEAKPITCSHCSQKVPVNLFEQHVVHCGARTQICDKCLKSIKNTEFEQHYELCFGQSQENTNLFSPSSSSYYASQYVDQYANESAYSKKSGSAYSQANFSAYSQSNSSAYSQTNTNVANQTTVITRGAAARNSMYNGNIDNRVREVVHEPRVISRRVVSGPRAGQELSSVQSAPTVQTQTYIDPVTGYKTTRTVTTRSYRPQIVKNSTVGNTKSLSYINSQPSSYQSRQTSTPFSHAHGGSESLYNDFVNEDPELQAALLASMGDQLQTIPYAAQTPEKEYGAQYKK